MGRANTFPVPLIWLDMDWDLSLNSGKQSLWWSLSQIVCYFWHLPVHCHFSDWQFLNLEFFAWHEDFFYITGTSTALICTHSCHVGNIQKYASTKLEIKALESLLGGESLWDPQVQFKMDCTVLANVGLPFEGTKGNYCTAWEPYSVLLWESLYEGFRFENHTRISGEAGNARSDLTFGKCGELLLSHK